MTDVLLITDGSLAIAKERSRQIKQEGFNDEHDKNENLKSIIAAAVIYANLGTEKNPTSDFIQEMKKYWPWDEKYYKPKDQMRNLERAGALIAAAIDKIKNKSNT